jgi:hypothetical protein
MLKNALFHIEGGLGKNIAATAVIRSYKKSNSDTDIIVTTAYPELFKNDFNIKRSFLMGSTPYFYEDYIYNKNIDIFAHDPYKTTNHITKKLHVIESWCGMPDVEFDKQLPNINFNFREKEMAYKFLPNTDKPLLIFQPFGGPQNQDIPYSWMRDIHPKIAQDIVNHFKEKYTILHICYPHHPSLQNVVRLDQFLNKKILCAMMEFSQKRILIDSSLQHAAAAMNLPSTVMWVGTQPEVFGYNIHNNIIPEKSFPMGNINSYLYYYSFNGLVHECPYDNIEDIFNIEKIVA